MHGIYPSNMLIIGGNVHEALGLSLPNPSGIKCLGKNPFPSMPVSRNHRPLDDRLWLIPLLCLDNFSPIHKFFSSDLVKGICENR